MNRRTLSLGLLVAIVSTVALGNGFLGPPTAGLERGQLNVGFNYTYTDTELDASKLTESFQILDAGGTPLVSDTDSWKVNIRDVKVHRYYGTIGYGITDLWEVYFQLGAADLKATFRDANDPTNDWNGLNFDNDFAYGWGTRYTFYDQATVLWGVSVQMNWLDTGVKIKSADASTTSQEQIDWKTYDLLIAIGPTLDMEAWKLYGGPFYYYLSGDLDFKGTETFPGGSSRFKGSGDLESENIGGFIGAECRVMEAVDLTIEYSITEDGWAIGAGAGMPF